MHPSTTNLVRQHQRRPLRLGRGAGRKATRVSSVQVAPCSPSSPSSSARKDLARASEPNEGDSPLDPTTTPTTTTTRRAALLLGGAAASTALFGAAAGPPAARAADANDASDASTSGRTAPPNTATSTNHPRVYLDVRIDGEPAGRLEIELLPEAAPLGSRRFADLAEEKGGVGFWGSKWDAIRLEKGYLRNAGAKSLSYSADGVSQVAGGDSTLGLEREMDVEGRPVHDRAGLVSLVVREALARPTKERLVAMGGKLVTVTTQAGEASNGSAFCVTVGPAPDLDKTNLVVGRLVPGPGTDAAVAALSALPVNRPREDILKPFFEAGKAIGDSRAVVAEKGFYRPLRRAIVSRGGPVV
jgi:peptidyl-prolyl cis-trans isomerase B (cyclophilin B)